MKKFVSLFLLLLLVSSCGLFQPKGGQLRLLKVGEKEELVLDRKKDEYPVKDHEHLFENVPSVAEVVYINEQIKEFKEQSESIELKSHSGKLVNVNNIEPEEEDPYDQLMVDMALEAERQANTSLYLFLSGLLGFLLPLVGMVLFAIGLNFFVKANNARFITPLGENRLRTARIFLVIDAVILILWISLIVFVILLF